jgi:two-component system, NarL family, nitrate/nitrite response regulator NarL
MAGARTFCNPILVVDDDGDVRRALVGALDRAGYRTQEAESGERAIELALAETPALVVLDVCLPGISGYEVCHDLRQVFGVGLPIVFVSAARTESYDRVAGLMVGGDDYLTKPVSPDELRIRVDRLMRNSAPLNPTVSGRLTAREREVLLMLAEGLRPPEVASRLVIAEKTVNTHIDHILTKLGVHSRAQAVALAYRQNLTGERVPDEVAG